MCIGAGALRNLVWDALHGQPRSGLADVDLAYFCAHDLALRVTRRCKPASPSSAPACPGK